jgi:hypothetical protein
MRTAGNFIPLPHTTKIIWRPAWLRAILANCHQGSGKPAMTTPHRKQVRSYNIPDHAHELTFSCFRRLPLLSRERTCR